MSKPEETKRPDAMVPERAVVPERNVSGGSVEERLRTSRDSLPGQRNALPAGALGGVPAGPQGDENRAPPRNAPTIPQ